MSEERILFPDLDARVAAFMDKERADGNEPRVIHDEIFGYTLKTRSVCILYGSFMTEFRQTLFNSGYGYGEIDEIWTSAWHARLLLKHLEKDAPGMTEGLKDEHSSIVHRQPNSASKGEANA